MAARPMAMTLFCDDARVESAGTVTLVGIFPDQVQLNQIPGQMDRLMVYTRILLDTAAEPQDMKVWLEYPDGTQEAVWEISAESLLPDIEKQRANNLPTLGVVRHIRSAPYVVNEPISLNSVFEVGGERTIIGKLQFDLDESAEAAEPDYT